MEKIKIKSNKIKISLKIYLNKKAINSYQEILSLVQNLNNLYKNLNLKELEKRSKKQNKQLKKKVEIKKKIQLNVNVKNLNV